MRRYRDQFNPKPRPPGFTPSDRPIPTRPMRPAPRRQMPPAVPAVFEPKRPATAKQRRRMRKAAAWRLAKIIHSVPAALLAMKMVALEDLIEQKCQPGKLHQGGQRGVAMRLAAKIGRLKR